MGTDAPAAARSARPLLECPRGPIEIRPVVRALPEDLTPLRALAAIERDPHTVFFESGGPVEEGAQWTTLAFDPLWRLELRAGFLRRISGDGQIVIPGEPMAALARAWPKRVACEEGSIPFVSGLAGYIGYDLKDCLEPYPPRPRRESSLPD